MNILLINLPPYVPKKPQNRLYYLQASMNLGMLAVASAAERQGHRVLAYDWLGPQQCALDEELPTIIADFRPEIVGFSIPSGYAEPYLRLFAPLVRGIAPSARILVGGQYHVGFRAAEILHAVREVDAVAIGAGEAIDWLAFAEGRSVPGLIGRESRGAVATKPASHALEPLRWSVSGFDPRGYAPSIEIGRGCPFTCSFCSLSGAPERLSRGTMEMITEQLTFWTTVWGDLPRVPIYAECPVFFCNHKNLHDYSSAFEPFAGRLEWRTQARVDSVDPAVFPELYSLGLRVIDLGLESASPRMLQLMNKTSKPDRYLQQAGSFIEKAYEAGIGIKLNILLYPGEDRESAAETEDFISYHANRLAGIAAGSTIEFPGTTLGTELADLHQRFGTKRVHDPVLAESGIYPLDLSADFSFEEARRWCVRVSQEVMDSRKYFDLKRIGYYSPTVTYEKFMEFADTAIHDALPFTIRGEKGRSVAEVDVGEAVVQWDRMR